MTGMEHAGHGDAFDTSAERVHETPNRVHVGMEHAIEQAADVLGAHQWSAAVGGCRGGSCQWHGGDSEDEQERHAAHVARALADAGLIAPAPLPMPDGGCQCTGHTQDYGGYVEYLVEYEPSCPEHSEHVWNPRTGTWEHAPTPLREVQAEAWDEGFRDCLIYYQSHGLKGREDNPYREPVDRAEGDGRGE